jgi:hypothetical protein
MDCKREEKQFGRRKVLYGLPCRQCRTYYDAESASCPVCECRERVPAQLPGYDITAS